MDHARARHQPACPRCGYRLVGHMRGVRSVRCPECGERSAYEELRWARDPRSNEWTVAGGLVAATRFVLLRGLVLMMLWTGLLWLLAPVINITPIGRGGVVFVIPCAVVGLGMGFIVSLGLVKAAGFTSWLLAAMAATAMVLLVIGGVWIVDLYNPIEHYRAMFIKIGVPIAAIIAIGWRVYSDS